MKSDLETSVKNDNSELSAVVGALLDTLNDKNEQVNGAVHEAIKQISHRNPETVIHACIYYFELHRKISTTHTISILTIMIETLRDQTAELSDDLADSVAELAIKKLIPDYEKEASELLVALSRLYCNQAMGSLLNKLEPGVIPPCSTLRAMGLVASCNPFGMVPFMKLTLSFILPMLPQVQEEEQKITFCFLFGKFAEAINDYIVNLDEAPDSRIGKETFYDEMLAASEYFINSWLKLQKSIIMVKSILSALCPILPLLPEEDAGLRMGRLIPLLLNFCKNPMTRLSSTRLIALMLVNCTKNTEDKEVLRPFIDPIQQVLFELVNVTPFEAFRDALLTHYEVLQCYRALVILFPEEGLDKILQHLRSPANLQRSRALVVVRHLINTLPSEDDVSLQRIALSIQNILGDSNLKQMVGPVISLVAHPTLSLLPSQRIALVKFIVLRCGTMNEETQAYEEALFLLATTVDGAENWLWASLLKVLLDSTYISSSVPVLRALTVLAIKIMHSEGSESSSNTFKEFSGTKILARCLELSGIEKNRLAVINFLRSSASLFGHQLKPEWNKRLLDLSKILDNSTNNNEPLENELIWEQEMVDFLEKSVQLEGSDWAAKLSKELAGVISSPGVPIYLGAVTDNEEHLTLLIHLSRSYPFNGEYSRAVGIVSKRHLQPVINLMEAACEAEDSRKNPTKLLGLMKDSKAAATAEASKASLLRCYGEIFNKSNISEIYPSIEKNILTWIMKQVIDCKEITSKEAGLSALEQLAEAVHPEKLDNSLGLKSKGHCLAKLLTLLQTHAGYRPIQLYPQLLKTISSLLKIPPELTDEENQVLLRTIVDKILGASSEMNIILKNENEHKVICELGEICSEIISDSSNALAELVDSLIPWMQSKLLIERKITLMVLCTTLKSYHNALKYTFPGGKLEPGKLLGRIICWSADNERPLRSIIVDAVILTLEIVTKHRSTTPDNKLSKDLNKAKSILLTEEPPQDIYNGVKILSRIVCQQIASDEIISLAEGLVEGLLFREESSLAGAIALKQLFKIRGAEIPRSDLYLIDNIVGQMRQMENSSSRLLAASAVKSLIIHHPEEVMEHLLHQPLPPDRETEECWRQIGNSEEFGIMAIDFIINRLENNHLFSQVSPTTRGINDKNSTASLASLSGIIALRHLLQASQAEVLIKKRLVELITILIKFLSGWVHADAPISVLSTKFGFVPNRQACKINPYREVYAVLANLLTAINMTEASSIPNDVADSDLQPCESLISTIRLVIRCLLEQYKELLTNIAQSLGKLVTSQIYTQRAAVIVFYSELIGKVDCGTVWLDVVMNILLEAKTDSSYLVRKFSIIGLGKIHTLEPKQRNEYLENCITALLDGLEEPSNNNEGSQVVLESLRGLEQLLSLKIDQPVSPNVILLLKPFVEKDNWKIRHAAIKAIGSLSRGWMKSVKNNDDDVTDHLLGCIPCLTIKVEDSHETVAKAARDSLYDAANLLQCEPLTLTLRNHLAPTHEFNVENFYKDLVNCLVQELPSRAEELKNNIVRGYSRSENSSIRSTSVFILGFFGLPGPEEIQRMLQLLRDKESIVKLRAAKALALGFTV
ncbi:maestro heat-like repeat-containing protein family member 1 [Chelonus insularis]|uniref:maestro heat-like repeat-containing protein family member 1 n=1 Tax=Chelonus insularis TaxID=460826 RepID=UPI00158E791D|nr:maestro heat-like repeat-containing protein family member 1 [Chelonus insularis]